MGIIIFNWNTFTKQVTLSLIHISIEELAERFEISPTSLKKCFKEMYGVPIYTYCRTYRLQIAEKMLREGQLSVAEIAAKIGYINPNNSHLLFALNTK